ncbi:MAG TPA: hypothetical protein VFW01_06540 [bacterium]|nr:hypothetical protein [bacterium]
MSYYLIMLTGMIVFLAGAIGAHLTQPAATQRVIFSGLFVLSLYMLFRTAQARRRKEVMVNQFGG